MRHALRRNVPNRYVPLRFAISSKDGAPALLSAFSRTGGSAPHDLCAKECECVERRVQLDNLLAREENRGHLRLDPICLGSGNPRGEFRRPAAPKEAPWVNSV